MKNSYKVKQTPGWAMAEITGPGLNGFLIDEPLNRSQSGRIEELLQRAFDAGVESVIEQQRLLKLVQIALPLDSAQVEAARQGIEQFAAEDAKEISDFLQGALSSLPDAVAKMEVALIAND